jgi:D-alanyl-D-alanine carboxypeptidase
MKTTDSTRAKSLSISLLIIFLWLLIPGQPETLHAEKLSQDPRGGIQDTGHMDRASCIKHHVSCPKWKSLCKLGDLLGNQDAVLVADAKGRILFSKDADKKLVPASSLKILTALVALHYLGPDYRFTTEFYLDKNLNLKIKGYGDTLFI